VDSFDQLLINIDENQYGIDTFWNIRRTEREDISLRSYELGSSRAVSCNRRERVIRVRLLSGDSNLRLSAVLSMRWARA
jgi:hypothetical protein